MNVNLGVFSYTPTCKHEGRSQAPSVPWAWGCAVGGVCWPHGGGVGVAALLLRRPVSRLQGSADWFQNEGGRCAPCPLGASVQDVWDDGWCAQALPGGSPPGLRQALALPPVYPLTGPRRWGCRQWCVCSPRPGRPHGSLAQSSKPRD